MPALIALLAGMLFGLGLAVSEMILPQKVLGFLNVAGDWDPSLILVMAAAIAVNFSGMQLVRNRAKPVFADVFRLPNRTDLDARLIGGAAIFGIGWGLAGYCPGPALAALLLGAWQPVLFVLALLAGSFASRALSNN